MKTSIKFLAVAALATAAQLTSAQSFSGGLPSDWSGVGTYGTLAADGVVTLAPNGGSQYGYVSTLNGVTGVSPFALGGNTTGSYVRSGVFTATAGDALNFNFNYITSDGAGYADYGWARLLNADLSEAAILFTARTTTSGNTVPGFDLPATNAIVGASPIIGGAPVWSALGGNSGSCYSTGCGYTGWISSTFEIQATGSYVLEFGAINWSDSAYQSGLAFDGITVAGVPINPVPEPETYALLLAGLGVIGAVQRRKKSA